MIIDTHIHVAAPDDPRYPLWADSPAGRDGSVPWFRRKAVTADQLLADMDRAKVDRGMLVQAYTAYGYDNSYAADAGVEYPDRLKALCTVEAGALFTEQVTRWVTDRGCVGVRLLAAGIGSPRWLHGDEAGTLWAFLADEGLVLDVAVNGDDLSALRSLAERFRSVPIVVDHVAMVGLGGRPSTGSEALFALAPLSNVHVKITPLLWEYTEVSGGDVSAGLQDLVDRFGPERLLWGSNYTATFEPSYEAMVTTAHRAFDIFDVTVRRQILSETASRLWWS